MIQFSNAITTVWPSVQMIILLYILFRHIPRRSRFALRFFGISAVLLVLCWRYVTPTPVFPDSMFSGLMTIFLQIMLVWCCLDISVWESIFIFSVGFSLQYLTYSCSFFSQRILSLIFSGQEMNHNILHVPFFLAECLLAHFLIEPHITLYRRYNHNSCALALLSIIGIGIDELLNYYMVANVLPIRENAFAFLCWRGATALCYVLLLCLMFNLLHIRNLQMDQERLRAVLEDQKKNYEVSAAAIGQINLYAHDLRHQLQILCESGQLLSGEMLDTLDETLDHHDAQIMTGCQVLDTILTQENLRCKQRRIRFSCIADGSGLAAMDPIELYTMFSNLLDNAIEAVQDEPEPRRVITLSIRKQNGLTSVHMENYFSGSLQFENGQPLTNKKDSELHGFGLTSVRMIVDHYDGTLSVNQQGDVFVIDILLPDKP